MKWEWLGWTIFGVVSVIALSIAIVVAASEAGAQGTERYVTCINAGMEMIEGNCMRP